MTTIRTYSELRALESYEDRVDYLRTENLVGRPTFGYDRWINQQFYRSKLWRRIRREVILRDNGCDLGLSDRPIYDRILVHHMNPIDVDAIVHSEDNLLDPEQLICVSHDTHNLIHYGPAGAPRIPSGERHPNDTIPWR